MKTIAKSTFIPLMVTALLLALGWGGLRPAPCVGPAVVEFRAQPQAIQAPVLKWRHGGCYSSWCETGWYASPAVADLDSDGTMEVIGGAYTLFILDGESGSLERNIDTPGGRIWPGVVVADVDDDGDLQIAVGLARLDEINASLPFYMKGDRR